MAQIGLYQNQHYRLGDDGKFFQLDWLQATPQPATEQQRNESLALLQSILNR